MDKLAAMSDDEVMMASTRRIGADTERLTRRNMKECLSEHIQTLCLEDPTFARKAMHPRKTMIHCIWYINRKAKEFVEQEMKDNGFKPENGIYAATFLMACATSGLRSISTIPMPRRTRRMMKNSSQSPIREVPRSLRPRIKQKQSARKNRKRRLLPSNLMISVR